MNRFYPIYTQNNTPNNTYEVQRLKQMLQYTIRNRTKTVQIFNQLVSQSTDSFCISVLGRLRAYDEGLLNKFTDLYINTYGPLPNIVISPEETTYPTYDAGLLLALNNKMDAIALERTFISLLGENDLGKKLYENALLTDIEEESLIGTLYNHCSAIS